MVDRPRDYSVVYNNAIVVCGASIMRAFVKEMRIFMGAKRNAFAKHANRVIRYIPTMIQIVVALSFVL